MTVWQDTDEDVRKFVRSTLFEDDSEQLEQVQAEKPPFLPLPPGMGSEVLVRWRRAREDALGMWAAEMSCDEEGGEEEGGEEEEAGSESAAES